MYKNFEGKNILVTTDFEFVNKFMNVHIYDWQRLFLKIFGYEIVLIVGTSF